MLTVSQEWMMPGGAGCGQVAGPSGRRAREPQQGAVRGGQRPDVHLVLLAAVRPVGGNPVGGDEVAVDDDEVALLSVWSCFGEHVAVLCS